MSEKVYIRDGRAPIPKLDVTSRIMSKIKAKNTKPELLLRKTLWDKGLKGYRIHCKKVVGRPDICYLSKKIAIFVHGCYWHRCPYCAPSEPKTHKKFWKQKFKNNKERDKKKEKWLKEKGWRVLVFWECQINKNINRCLNRCKKELGSI